MCISFVTVAFAPARHSRQPIWFSNERSRESALSHYPGMPLERCAHAIQIFAHHRNQVLPTFRTRCFEPERHGGRIPLSTCTVHLVGAPALRPYAPPPRWSTDVPGRGGASPLPATCAWRRAGKAAPRPYPCIQPSTFPSSNASRTTASLSGSRTMALRSNSSTP